MWANGAVVLGSVGTVEGAVTRCDGSEFMVCARISADTGDGVWTSGEVKSFMA